MIYEIDETVTDIELCEIFEINKYLNQQTRVHRN